MPSPTTPSTSSSSLYDSITDLDTVLVAKVDMSKATRTDFGHFDGASVAVRHWDSGEQVDASCSSCHGGADGFRFYVQYGVGEVVQETAERARVQHLPRQARDRLHRDHRRSPR